MEKHSWFTRAMMVGILAAFGLLCSLAFAGTIPSDIQKSDPQKAYLPAPSAMFTAGPVMKTVGQVAVPASHGTVTMIGIASPGHAFDIAKASLREPHAAGLSSSEPLNAIAATYTDYRDSGWKPNNDGLTALNSQSPNTHTTASHQPAYAQAPGYRLNGFKVSLQSGLGGPDNDGLVIAKNEGWELKHGAENPGICLI